MLFKKKQLDLPENWITLNSSHNVELILGKPDSFLVFKHSTRCPISSRAFNQMVEFINESDVKSLPQIYYVDVIGERSTSTNVEKLTGVSHESPQLIYMKNGSVEWTLSHGQIRVNQILKLLTEEGRE